MGLKQSKLNNSLVIRTGDQRMSSTDSNVYVILHDKSGVKTDKSLLDNFLKNDFKTGATDTFHISIPETFQELHKLEIWLEPAAVELVTSSWFVDTIEFVQRFPKKHVIFPTFRWLRPNIHYWLYPYDTFLPQDDPDKEQRANEIEHKRNMYKIKYEENSPVLCKSLPVDEEFSPARINSLFLTKMEVLAKSMWSKMTSGSWKTLDDLTNIYYEEKLSKPESVNYWNEDKWFGYQRLNGSNPMLITLCEEIPSNLAVDAEVLKPVLKEESLEDLLRNKRLFYTDLAMLEGVKHKEGLDMSAPIALFMLNSEDDLMPIAIQLRQQKGEDNPVFLPTDDASVWTLAKMWYNIADSSHHQSLVHLGLTHLLMEGIVLAMHRNISVSHPLFKLAAPHTLYLLAINSRGFAKLVSPGGWVDMTMTIGIGGMFQLIYNGIQNWDFSLDGVCPKELANRKVDDPKVLPKYYFRDDSVTLYDCIYKYVSHYVDVYYATNDSVLEDFELQDWVQCISTEGKHGGIGIKGLPVKDGKCQLTTKEEVKQFMTTIVFTCSVSHAHANFLQYEEYAFPANYPTLLRTPILKDKTPRSEEYLIDTLPDKDTTLKIMAITHLLSEKCTNSLGNFETEYIYDPKAIPAVIEFRKDLKEIEQKINARNKTLPKPYDVLNPINIPNAISI